MPTLEEALDVCEGLLVNIEIKNLPGDPDHDPDEQLVAARWSSSSPGAGDAIGYWCRRSASTRSTACRRHDPSDSDRASSSCSALTSRRRRGARVRTRGHGAVHPFVGSLPDRVAVTVVERAHEVGVDVNVWTVNDADEMRRLADAGVDAIITDVPDVARQAFA